MQLAAQQDYLERFGDILVPMGPFAARKLGLDPAQTSLKIDTYNLACAPYRFGMKGAVLLCFLSRDELAFFQRFQGGMGGIGLSLQPANRQQPVKIFARCTLNAFTPMKGRDNVGLVAVDWKPCPPDLLEALGEYQDLLERLKAEYEERKELVVPINAPSAKVLGYNNFATLASGGEPFKAALFGLSSARLDFLLPLQAPELAEGAELQAKLYFQKYQFSVAGKLASIERLPTGVRRARVGIGFSPELVELLGDYGFASRLAAKREGEGA